MTQLYGGIIGKVVEPTTSKKVTSFTSSGTFYKGVGDEAELLVVAGGASGGGELGGGGGAGGFRRISQHPLPTSPVTVTVGAGGATQGDNAGNNGNDSIFDSEVSITSVGGGGGGAIGSHPAFGANFSRTGGSAGGTYVGGGQGLDTKNVDYYQVLNIHSDTYDGDTTFKDTSNRGHFLIVNGDAQHSITQAKFGKTSMKFDGTLDSINLDPGQPSYDDFNFGNHDFTVECWVYPTSFDNTYNAVFNNFRDDDNTSGWSMLLKSDGKVHCNLDGTYNDSTNTVSTNTWTHIAMVRYGGTVYRYINGTEAGNTLGFSTDKHVGETTQTLHIGSSGSEYTDREFTGYIDEVRITKGYAWYVSNFTAPTKPFPDNPYSVQGHSGGGGKGSTYGRAGGGGGAGQGGFTGEGPYTANTANGKGGDGIATSISGSSVTYAGGGGGGTWQPSGNIGGGKGGAGGGGRGFGNDQPGYSTNQESPSSGWPGPAPGGLSGLGVVNTGSGGGGGSNGSGSDGAGGGSGIVIVSEPAGNFKVASGVYNMHDVFHYRTQGQW